MRIFKRKGKAYELDADGFLLDPKKRDPDVAEGHGAGPWHSRRADQGALGRHPFHPPASLRKPGNAPTLFETCRANNLRRNELKRLFPTGYMRGACKLAGVSYKEAYLGADYMEHSAKDLHAVATRQEYRVDVRGFLVDPDELGRALRRSTGPMRRKWPAESSANSTGSIIRLPRWTDHKTGIIPTVSVDLRSQRHRYRRTRTAVPGRLSPGER